MDEDLGVLLIRIAVGVVLVVHGANKVWGTGGLGGTTAWFKALGLEPAWLHARVAALTEILTGLFLAAGFLTNLAGAAVVGLMVVAGLTDHRGKGFFVFKGGWEYVALLAATAVGVVAIGPGRLSVDHVLSVNAHGTGWALAAAFVGAASGLLLLAGCYRPASAVENLHQLQ